MILSAVLSMYVCCASAVRAGQSAKKKLIGGGGKSCFLEFLLSVCDALI